MHPLKELQQQMLRDLMNHQSGATYLNNSERLDVYGQGYFVRMIDILGQDFSHTRAVIGEKLFDEVAGQYVRSNPSQSYNLGDYGEGFPEFISQTHTEFPWLTDLTTYEKNQAECFNALAIAPIVLEKFKDVPMERWEDAIFVFQKHLILQKASWPIHLLIQSADKNFSTPNIQSGEYFYLIHQHENSTYVMNIEKKEFDILSLLVKGQSLGDVCRSFDDESLMESIFAWFQNWNSLGLITDIKFESHESA